MKLKTIEENEEHSDYFMLIKIGYTDFLIPYLDGQKLLSCFKRAMICEREYKDNNYVIKLSLMKDNEIEVKHIDNDQVKEILATQKLMG